MQIEWGDGITEAWLQVSTATSREQQRLFSIQSCRRSVLNDAVEDEGARLKLHARANGHPVTRDVSGQPMWVPSSWGRNRRGRKSWAMSSDAESAISISPKTAQNNDRL
ncbi:hypothetical protein D3C87_897820 [compost metagenome]